MLKRTLAVILFWTNCQASLVFAQASERGQAQSMTPLEKHIHSVCKQVKDDNKTTDKLTGEDLADLPVGIARQIGNGVYVIAIDSAYWDGRGWYFTAYASIQLPGSSNPIAFRASKVGFNKGGLTFTETKMELASPQYISITDQLALELPADGGTYLEFDCNGFKSVNLKGNFVFTDSSIVPDKDKTSSRSVTATVEINTQDLSNIIASVNEITPFKIAGIDDLSFEVKNATIDLSDFRNPDGFVFPQDYQGGMNDTPQLWRGFYLEELAVNFKGFEKNPTTIQARQMIIDDSGLSGIVTATSVLSIDEGSADGWPISINTMSLTFVRNRLTAGGFSGDIRVPLLGDEPLGYTGDIEHVGKELNYKFLVNTTADKEFQTKFSATIKLAQGSTVAVERANGEFTASATLHGMLSVKNDKMEAKGINFENLVILSRAPYVKAPTFSTSGIGPKAMGFPVRLENVSLKTPEEGKVALGFDVVLNFMSEETKGFSGKGRITLLAKMEESNSSTIDKVVAAATKDWTYDGIKFGDISLDCSTTAFSVKGKLNILENDPEFGDGFTGSISLSIAKVLERGVKVNAYFGSKDDFRYWHLDAYAPTGAIPIAPSLFINGIIGGASYKMVRKETFKPDFSKLNTTSAGASPEAGTLDRSSDFAFTPDGTAGLSFMAGVTLIAGSEKAFNSDAVLDIAFNASGGFRYVQFKGTGYFFTSLESRGRPESPGAVNAPVYADLNMLYDHTNGVFHSNLKTYMNLEGTIRGTGPNNMIGEAVMHYDSKDWYIYIGRSSQMLGVDIARLAVAQGYFMAGTKVEGLPLPPAEMRDIMSQRSQELIRDETALAMGRGFATGIRFETGFDSKDKLTPFYAVLKIGAGVDMMIRDFGNATCAGSTNKIGFDGWYASGQAYVFMKGKVGVKVGGSKFDFLSLGAAALLQAKLPNPTWLKGELAGKYSVLGGWVSGKFNLNITVGDECEIITPGSELGNLLVISDIKPDDNTSDVSVFSSPQVSFNTAIDTEFRMLNNADEVNSYRVKLDEFTISSNGQVITTTPVWNGRKDALSLRTTETLPPQTKIRVFAKLHWEKLENGTWSPLLVNNATSFETKEVSFTTGDAPDFIPDENIAFTYPVNRQYNLLPKETNKGYIKLKIGQAYLFQAKGEERWTYLARFTDPTGSALETTVAYSDGESMVRFAIPDALKNQTVYSISLIKRPESQGSIDSNVRRESISKNVGDNNEVNIASTVLTGTATQKIEKEIYASAFRTSKFNNFTEKWTSLSGNQNLFGIATGNIALIGKSGNLQETFDEFDLNGYTNRNQPLVQVIASPNNNWLTQGMGPILYDTYPADPTVVITNRNTEILGVKPLKAVRLTNDQQEYYKLSDANLSSGTTSPQNGGVKLLYYLSFTGFNDFVELRNKAARVAMAGSTVSAGVQKILSAQGYIDLISGTYPVDIKYVLPGTNEVTSQNQISIEF